MSNNLQSPPGAQEFDIDIFKLVEQLFLFRWRILLVAVLFAGAMGSYKYFTFVKSYTAYVYIISTQPADDFLSESAAPKRTAFDDTAYEMTLKSDVFLKNVVSQEFVTTQDGKTEKMSLTRYFQALNDNAAASMLKATIKLSRQKTLMVLSVTMRDADMSAAVANALATGLNLHIRKVLTSNASSNLDFVESRMNKINQELVQAREKLIAFLDTNKQLSLFNNSQAGEKFPQLAAEKRRLEQEIVMKLELYTKLVSKFEMLKIEVGKETPYVNVLQYASVPTRANPRGTTKSLAIGFVLGLFLASSVAVLISLYQTFVPTDSLITKELAKDKRRLRRLLFLSRG